MEDEKKKKRFQVALGGWGLFIVVLLLFGGLFVCLLLGFAMAGTSTGSEVGSCPPCPKCPTPVACPACPDDVGECPECPPVVECPELECPACPEPECPKCVVALAYPFKGPGQWLVNVELAPGRYKAEGDCLWQRQSCLDSTYSCVISQGVVDGQGYLEVKESDLAFQAMYGTCVFYTVE